MDRDLIQAIKSGDRARVVKIVDATPSLAGTCDETGVSLIFLALYHRQENIAQFLARNVTGISLHEAAALGDTARLVHHLNSEVDLVHTPTADGFYAQHLAGFFGRDGALDLLLRYGADPNSTTRNDMALYPLNSAVAGGSLRCVKLLLEAGARVNCRASGGFTPLMSAAGNGNAQILELLLVNGAQLGLRCSQNKSAADYASEKGHDAIVARLEKAHGL